MFNVPTPDLVSIILPLYNARTYLPACIQSLLNQTYPAWELILVDDGSTDGGGELCDAYASRESRIQVIHQENRGVSAARNEGIRAASGSYICFMDSDDTVEPTMLADMMAAMTKTHADLVTCGLTYVGEESEESPAYTVREGYISLPSELNGRYRELAHARILNSHCGKMFKKEMIERHSLRMVEGLSTLEDGIFVLDYLAHCSSMYCLPSGAYHYRQTIGSLQKQNPPNALQAWLLYVQKYRDLTKHLDAENTRSVYSMLWHRYRSFLTRIYADAGMSTAQKRTRMRTFVKEIHRLDFFNDLPQCPEKGFRKRLLFSCVKHRLTLPLHLLLCLRYPVSS